MDKSKPNKKVLTGTVVSDQNDKTIVVRIARRKMHKLYKKYISISKKVKAHDSQNECHVGDVVRVIESRPLSKDKRWRLLEVIKRIEE